MNAPSVWSGGAVALLAMGIVSCGGKVDDPKALPVAELNPASGLVVSDLGNGTVDLGWNGNNYSEDFSGYNIYGAHFPVIEAALDIAGLKEGDALALLDEKGEVNEAARNILQKMAYDRNAPFALNGSPQPEGKFSAHPVNAGVFPSCRPHAEGDCVAPDRQANGEWEKSFAGSTHYRVSGLETGRRYCFVVFSTAEDGQKIAAVSTPLTCVEPRIRASLSTASVELYAPLMLDAVTMSRAGRFDEGQVHARAQYQCDAATAEALCIEKFGDTLNLTAGHDAGLHQLGYRPDGLASVSAPTAVPDARTAPGESLIAQEGHAYLLVSEASSRSGAQLHIVYVYRSAEGEPLSVDVLSPHQR